MRWWPPSPVLFQRRFTTENRAITDGNLRRMLNAALACTGLTDPADGLPLRYTPHDFRRIFITDAVMNGLPPHIAQVIAGHKDINTTMATRPFILKRPSSLTWRSWPADGAAAHRRILCPQRRGMAGIPRAFRAPESRDRNMRARIRHALHS